MSPRTKKPIKSGPQSGSCDCNKINPSGVGGAGQIIIIYLNLIKTFRFIFRSGKMLNLNLHIGFPSS